MSEVRFGVLGCGENAMTVLQGLSAAPNASVAILMDDRAAVLRDLAEVYSAPTTTDIEKVLSSDAVDAVYVALPVEKRAQAAIRAAQAGKHVLVECPMASTLAEADELIAACESSGVKLGVALEAQVDAGLAAARDMVRAGLLGEVVGTRIALASAEASADIGAQVMPSLNALLWVTGAKVASVCAQSVAAGGAQMLHVLLGYEGGAAGVVQVGALLPGGEHEDVAGPRIYGTKGQLILAESGPLMVRTESPEGGLPNVWQALRYSGSRGDAGAVVSGFAAAVAEDDAPPVGRAVGRALLEVVAAAYRSAETGEVVSLP